MRRFLNLLGKIVLYTVTAIVGLFILSIVIFLIFGNKASTESTGAVATATRSMQIILVASPTPEPTHTPVPTSTSRPARIPTATDAPDYRTNFMVALSDLVPAMTVITSMLDRPNYGDPQWTATIHEQLDLVDAVYGKLLIIVPPPKYRVSHALYLTAVSRCRDSAAHYRLAVDNNDLSEVTIGTALLNSCAEQVKGATAVQAQQ